MPEAGLRKAALGFSRACLLAIVGLVPLIVLPWWSDPLQLPKLQAMELLEAAAAVGLIVALGLDRLWRSWRASPLFWPAIAYLAWVGVSTVTSINLSDSIWGISGRWAGAPTLLAYVALAFLVQAAFPEPRSLRVAAAVALAASVPVAAYGLAQFLGWDFVNWNVDWTLSAFSTMGNPDFLACYELLYVFLAGLLYLGGASGWLLLPVTFAATAALWATQTRSAWLVFLLLAVCVVIWVRRRHPPFPRVRARLRRLAVVWVVAIAAVLAAQPAMRVRVVSVAVDAARMVAYVLHRAPPTVAGETGNSMAQRVWIWRGVVPMIAARPWTGWGPDTMYHAFPRYQAPNKARVFPPGIAIDRAHNNYLQVAVDSGLPALAAYLWLLAAAFACGRRGWRALRARAGGDPLPAALLLAALAGGAAYWIEIAVNIAMPASTPHAWFWLGAMVALGRWAEGAASTPAATAAGGGPA